MILGFTGTWHQPPPAQEITLRKLFVGVDTLHHGDCIGADALAHSIAVEYGIKIVVHPPLNEIKVAVEVPSRAPAVARRGPGCAADVGMTDYPRAGSDHSVEPQPALPGDARPAQVLQRHACCTPSPGR